MKRRAFFAPTGAAALGGTAAEARKCPPATPGPWFGTDQDDAGEWRWRLRAANGDPIVTPGEGFKTRAACDANIALVQSSWNADVR